MIETIKYMIFNIAGKIFGGSFVFIQGNSKEQSIPLNLNSGRRFAYFFEHLKRIKGIEGAIVECGVGWGRSLVAIGVSSLILERPRNIHAFDSFNGFPDPSEEDDKAGTGVRKGRYTTSKRSAINHLNNSGLGADFVRERVTFYTGYFNETLSSYSGEPIAFLHLDGDLYASYIDPLNHLYSLVVKGGVIAFDEYHDVKKFPGARKAIDEFFEGKEKIQYSPIINRYYVIKE